MIFTLHIEINGKGIKYLSYQTTLGLFLVGLINAFISDTETLILAITIICYWLMLRQFSTEREFCDLYKIGSAYKVDLKRLTF